MVLESRQVTEAGAFPIRKMPVRVLALTKKSHDVVMLRLQLPAGEPLQFHAGQYIEFILRDGTRRSYSMANAPHTLLEPGTGIELHIRHLPGGKFTDHVFGAMKEKEILRVEGPYGSFFLREESDKPLILLASGTGFAPIKAAARAHEAQGHRAAGDPVLGRPAPRGPLHGRLGPRATRGDAACCAMCQ